MAEISDVPGIGGSTLELFKRAGFGSAEALAQRSVGEILTKLEAANRDYDVPVRLPSEASVQTWQNAAKSLLRRSGQVEVMPAATQVNAAALQAAGIDVNAMPVAKVVDDSKQARLRTATSGAPLADKSSAPPARANSTPAEAGGEPAPGPAKASPAPQAPAASGAKATKSSSAPLVKRRIEGVARPQAPTVGTPAGGNDAGANRFRAVETVQRALPPSERRNRGMSHPDAGRVRVAAAVTVLAVALSTVAALTLAAALVMAMFYGWHFEWTIALLILVFPVSLAFYLAIGTRVRCRLCGQRLFVPKNCHKHEKARRSIFGYTFAVARDAAFLAGYRCMLCGTKTRLKD